MAPLAAWIRELLRKDSRNVAIADDDRVERGLPLEQMDSSGIRSRLNVGRQSTAVEETAEQSTETFEIVGSSIDDASPQAVGESEATVKESFIRTNLGRLSTTLGPGAATVTAKEKRRLDEVYGYANIKKERYQELPQGFPRLAAFMSADEDGQMYRGFKSLHNRTILQSKVELTELEKQLAELDERDASNPATSHRLIRTLHKEGWDEEQRQLLGLIKVQLKEYDELVLRHAQVQALGRPPKQDFLAFFRWLHKNPQLAEGYGDFIYHADDFVGIGSRSNYFEKFIRNRLQSWLSPVKWLLITDDELAKADKNDPSLTFYSPSRLRTSGTLLLVLVTIGFLLTPILSLFLVPMSRAKMATTASVSIVLFSVVMSIVTGAQVYKVFVATATYSAIVVTFLGNVGDGGAAKV